ncbi:MAG: hypothetical protein M3R16_02045, partial [Pseudomonadota bacterium]|nr:hypothetical protein [Pseudomonadota bacterium]
MKAAYTRSNPSYGNPRAKRMSNLPLQRSPTTMGIFMLISALAMPEAFAQGGTTSEGTAYRLDDGKAAYREQHLLHDSGGRPARLVLYRCMDGSAFARKSVVARADAATPDFDFVDGRTGYREGVRTTASSREVYLQKSATSAEKKQRLKIPTNAVIDAGFDAHIRARWSNVADGAIRANFLL